MNLNQVTLPALNIAESTAFYKKIGFVQIVEAEHYARFECGTGDSTFSIHKVDSVPEDTGVVIYFEIEALDDKVAELKQRGFTFWQDPKDESWLWREARLKDPSGNIICLYFAGINRKNPPWRVAE
jgi:predicted enzyme related to lactoylglutathione lyase